MELVQTPSTTSVLAAEDTTSVLAAEDASRLEESYPAKRTAVLGYSEDIGALFHAKRDFASRHLNEFKELLTQTQSPARHCSDEMMCRFLETNVAVRNREVKGCSCKQAAKDIESTVKWRAANGLDGTTHPLETAGCVCCDQDPYAHCCFSIGVDKRGWMATYMCPGRTTNRDPARIERHLVLLLEQMFREPNAPHHFCILLDLHGFSLADMDPRVAMRLIPCVTPRRSNSECLQPAHAPCCPCSQPPDDPSLHRILLNHYPDRVAQVAILDSPWVFKVTWNVIKQVADPLSQSKAVMLRGEEMQSYFSEFLTADQASFARGMLALKAAPKREAFVDTSLCARLRASLGPDDAFTRETRQLLQEQSREEGK